MNNVTTLTLDEIEELAKTESAKQQHFYVGVEHLFIALTKLEGGITSDILEQAIYLRYAVRDQAGHGDNHRYWPGYRTTPRAAIVLDLARDFIARGVQPAERALLMAILNEGDSIPIRALRESGIDLQALHQELLNWSGQNSSLPPMTEISEPENFSEGEQQILRQMFRRYDRINIDHVFNEGFSGSKVLLIRPQHADGRSDAQVVVKLDDKQAIQWEKKRYDSFVKDTLPLRTARIEAEPVLDEYLPLGGLKYTFLRTRDEITPTNLAEFAKEHTPTDIANFLREGLYDNFRETWWGQAQPYSFNVWQEYELVLPPSFRIEARDSSEALSTSRVLRPLGDWSRNKDVQNGDIVVLESFTALKVKRDKGILQLAAGAGPEAINWASRVELFGLDFAEKSYYRGEPVRQLIGRIASTRDDILLEQAEALQPDFDLKLATLPGGSLGQIPNPLIDYRRLLEQRISGKLSTIHGDLHTGNVLIGPGGDAWLIDFEWTRDGHALFDWAVLEVSLLIDYVATFVGEDWSQVREAVLLLDALNQDGYVRDSNPLARAFLPIAEIRHIAAELLASRTSWMEYFTALALVALRVISWRERPLVARRLAFLIAALAMQATKTIDGKTLGSRTDISDLTTDQGSLG